MTRKSRFKQPKKIPWPPRVPRTGDKKEKLVMEVERMASFPLLNPNPVFEIDFSGKVTFYNKAAMDALRKHGVGDNIRAFFPPDITKLLKTARHSKKMNLTRKVLVKNAIFAEGIHIASKYKAIRFYLRDITDRERTEQALRESEDRFKSLFQGLPISTVVFQKTGRDFVIKEFNRASVAFTKGRMARFLGRSARELYATNPEILKKFDLALKKKTPQFLQTYYTMLSTGKRIYLNLKLAFIPPDLIIMHSEDITERKRYETALKDAKENLENRVHQRTAELERARSDMEAERQRLYEVLETLPVYVVLLSGDYHVPFANRFFRERFGESRGRRCYEYLFKRKSPCAVCESFKAFKTGQPHRWEWTGPDGRNYDIYDFPFKDADGTRLIMEMGIDITEQKRAQEALARANEYHRMLIEVSLDPLVTISAEGKITDVNEATIKATGVPRRKLVGTDFSNYFTDPQKAREGYKQVFAQGFVADYPLTIRHRDGGLKNVLYNASVYKDEQGKILGVFAAARDITVLKKAEDELKRHRDHLEELVKDGTRDLLESQERLQRAEEIAHLGGWELNLADNRLTWSDEVYRIFGLRPNEFDATYKAFLEHIHPEDRAMVDEAYSGSLREGKDSYEIEHRVVRKDNGEIRWVHERCVHHRDAKGRVIRSVGMVHDITARKRTENEMRALNLRLEEINEQLKDFVFTVSHDLKAPLRAIQGYADALLEDYKDKLDAPGLVNIERIATAVQRLDTMIQDLLAYSRLSSEQIVIEPVDLEKIIGETIEGLKTEAALKNARFSVEPNLPSAGAHNSILQQVVENLILNAITYVKPGIEPDIRIWSETHGDWVYIYIKDNGIGIAPENQERIFKVFERLHGVESYPGTGVGLAIVKKGIERMGGKLGVISTLGEGSTFWIALPRVDLAKGQ